MWDVVGAGWVGRVRSLAGSLAGSSVGSAAGRAAIGAVALTTLIFASSGCVSGLLYTHTITPLTTNFDATPVVDTMAGKSDIKHFRYYLIDLQWHSNAIGDVAKAYGFDRLFYADLETLTILGFWTQKWVHLYGTFAETRGD